MSTTANALPEPILDLVVRARKTLSFARTFADEVELKRLNARATPSVRKWAVASDRGREAYSHAFQAGQVLDNVLQALRGTETYHGSLTASFEANRERIQPELETAATGLNYATRLCLKYPAVIRSIEKTFGIDLPPARGA